MPRALKLFLLVMLVIAALAYFGPRFGLIGCDTLPELAVGPCSVGRTPPR